MKMLSLDDAIKAVTMLLDDPDDIDKIWSCDVINNLKYAPSVEEIEPAQKWISVKDKMPKQHKSIFAPWYGTKTWSAAMWKEESETVIVAGRFPDGSKTTTTGRLCDSKWETRISKTLNFVVTHWMPLPEPPKEDENA